MPTAIALALGLEPGNSEPAAQVIAHLRRKELLLILDNMEQLLARLRLCEHCWRPVLARASSLPAVNGCTCAASTLPGRAAGPGCSCRALFAEPAAASDPGFHLLPAPTDHRAQIAGNWTACRWLSSCARRTWAVYTPRHCWPAARSPAGHARDGPGDLPVRHQTLANAIHRSYLLLPRAAADCCAG